MSVKCVGTKQNGQPCPNWAVNGATVCKVHGGMAKQVRTRAAVRHELTKWVLGDITEDPGEVLLRLVTQASRRVALYSSLLEELYAKADAGEPETTLPARVGVLIGRKYVLGAEGRPVPVEEAIRGLVELEQKERQLCADFAAKAIAAGLAERQVRVAEKMGSQIAEIIRAVVLAPQVGLSEAQRIAVLAGLRSQLGLGEQTAIESGL